MRYYFSLVLCLSFSFISTVSFSQSINVEKPINILVLHSYSPSYQWTMNIEEGIKDAIKNTDQRIRLSVEFMDSKRVDSEIYKQNFIKLLSYKYPAADC